MASAEQKKPEPKIVHKDGFLIAGLRYEGDNAHGEIPAMWDTFIPRRGEFGDNRVGAEAYGVLRLLRGVPADQGFEYLAAVQVRSLEHLPEGMVGWKIPALTYAVFPAHDVAGIGPVEDYVYKEWLPQSKEYRQGAGPLMEVYPETFGQNRIIYLHFAVKRKQG